jgi:hypothetical protein
MVDMKFVVARRVQPEVRAGHCNGNWISLQPFLTHNRMHLERT